MHTHAIQKACDLFKIYALDLFIEPVYILIRSDISHLENESIFCVGKNPKYLYRTKQAGHSFWFSFFFGGGGGAVFTVAEAVVQYFIKINHEVLRDLFYTY